MSSDEAMRGPAPPPEDPDPGVPAGPPEGADLRRASTLVAAGILASRLAGLGREVLTAALLATGPGAEAFKAALRIPNLLQNLLGEGVLSASFVPAYSRLLAQGRHEDAGRLAGAVAGLLTLVTSVIVAVGVVFAPAFTRVVTPGWLPGEERFELTVTLVRIVTPGVGLLVLSAWCLGILNSHRRFFLSYVAPVVWNVAIIAAVVGTALATRDEVPLAVALAVGAAVGSVLQLAVQLPTVLRLAGRVRPSLSLAAPGVRDVVRRFGQVVAGRGGVQLASYVDLVLASLLAAGAFAALTYAQVLYLLPIALFGMSVAAAELPTLSTMDHGDRGAVVRRLDVGLGRVAFFVVPSAVAFVVTGPQLVGTVFGFGRWSADDTAQVALVLGAYALGLLASTSSRLLQSALYGVGDTRSPAIYAVLRVSLSLAVGLSLMLPLDAFQVTAAGVAQVGEVTWSIADASLREGGNQLRLGAVGLALGAAIGAWFELALLRARIRVVFGRTRLGGTHAGRIAAGAAIAIAAGLAVRWLADGLPPRPAGIVAVAVVGGAYLAVTAALRVPEARDLLATVTRRRG